MEAMGWVRILHDVGDQEHLLAAVEAVIVADNAAYGTFSVQTPFNMSLPVLGVN